MCKCKVKTKSFRVCTLLKRVCTEAGRDLAVAALLGGEVSLTAAARLRVADLADAPGEMGEIVRRRASASRRYLFDLNQSRQTARQLALSAESAVCRWLLGGGIKPIGSAENTLRLTWACAALRCGLSGSEVLAMLGSAPCGIPSLKLCTAAQLSAETRRALAERVGSYMLTNPLQWYALKLRRGVDFETLAMHLGTLAGAPRVFYPLEEIRRRVGHRLVKVSRPMIANVVFIQARAADIHPLMCTLGHLAWCYTTTGRPGSDYAHITPRAFADFQRAIGHSIEAATAAYTPQPGDAVHILSRALAEVEFRVADTGHGADLLCRLLAHSPNGFRWHTLAPAATLLPTNP